MKKLPVKRRKVLVGLLKAAEGVQMRVGINPAVVAEYTDAMLEGALFPAVVAFEDSRGRLWVADGFHRLEAAKRAGIARLSATVHSGRRRDAMLFAVGANAEHGLRRTNADKRRAVMHLLADRQWSRWSDREIARRARVSNRFVSTLRKEVTVNVHSEQTERLFRTKHGTTARMNVEQIGSAKRSKQRCPDAYLNTILAGDCVSVLKSFPDECIDCIVTSPPYWSVRDFSVVGSPRRTQHGLEPRSEKSALRLSPVGSKPRRLVPQSGDFPNTLSVVLC